MSNNVRLMLKWAFPQGSIKQPFSRTCSHDSVMVCRMNAFVINEEMDVPPTAAEETTVATSAHSRIKLDPPDCMEGVGPDFEPQVRRL